MFFVYNGTIKFKIKYYLEKREPDFNQKMHDVLVVYKQVSMQFDEDGNLIVPEDGIQTIGNTCSDRNPDAEHGFIFAPKHDSWLNRIESFFSKLTKQIFDEINQEAVVYHWTYKIDEADDAKPAGN